MDRSPVITTFDHLFQIDFSNKLGQGQFGTVVQGIAIPTNEKVAIKLEPSPDSISLMNHEATVLNYLYRKGCHDCVPKIYGIYPRETELTVCFAENEVTENEVTKSPMLIITYYDGNVVQSPELFTINAFCSWILALAKIHTMGVIHRDIKPANLMFNKESPAIIDFGLSFFYREDDSGSQQSSSFDREIVSPNKTQLTMVGTPKYASPFVHMGNTPSRRDDLISLGFSWVDIHYPHYFKTKKNTPCCISLNDPIHSFFLEKKNLCSLSKFLPHPITRFFELCYSLKYEEIPCYEELIDCLSIIHVLDNSPNTI
jgi:serine/threonine protein kinase